MKNENLKQLIELCARAVLREMREMFDNEEHGPASYNDLANMVANSPVLFKLMARAGVTNDDMENNSPRFFDFILRNKEKIQAVGEFPSIASDEQIEHDWYQEYKNIKEMTTTGAVSGYNIPAAFSRRGGSDRGVEGSRKLGFELTPLGKKQMNKQGDKI